MEAGRLALTTMALVCTLGGELVLSSASAFSFVGHPLESQITESQIASTPPPAPGSFQPGGLAVDNSLGSLSSGDLYIADGQNKLVDKFNTQGEYQSPQLTGAPGSSFAFLEGVAVDSVGNVYVADRNTGAVDKFDSSGTFVSGAGGPVEPFIAGTPTGPFSALTSVAVDSAGNVYVVDAEKGTVDKFNSSGDFVSGAAGPTSPFIPNTTLRGNFGAAGVAVDAIGNVFIANRNGWIEKYDSSGIFVPGPGGPNSPFLMVPGVPYAIAVDNSRSSSDPAAGDLYVSTVGDSPGEGSTPVVYAFDPSGKLSSTLSASFTNTLGGIAVDSAGRLYVSDSGLRLVDIFGSVVVPDINLSAPSNVQQTSATLNGTVNPGGLPVTSCQFEYGTTLSYGNTVACAQSLAPIGDGDSPVPVSADIPSGLMLDTTYHFRLVAGNAHGVNPSADEITPSSDKGTFTTLGVPTVDEESTANILKTSARLQAQVNPHGFATTYHFEYGMSTSYGATQPIPDSQVGEGVSDALASAEVTQLQASTIYHFRVVATNSAGPTVYGQDETFETTPVLRIDSVYATEIGTEGATLTAYINPLGPPDTTYHFEYGTDTSYGANIPVPDEDVGSGIDDKIVTARIVGLRSDTTYHFRVVAHNSLGSVSSPDTVFASEPVECPTASLRAGFSMNLPDCRVYEMVSPPYKADYGIREQTMGVAPDGERAVFTSLGAFAGAQSDVLAIPYISRRDPTKGWVTSSTNPPPVGGRIPALTYDYSPDLTRGLSVLVSAELGVTDRTALISSDLSAHEISFAQVWPIPDGIATIPERSVSMSAASADLSHAVFGQSVGSHAGLEEVVGIGGPHPQVLPIGGSGPTATLSEGAHPINTNGSEIFFDGTSVRVNDSATLALPGKFAGASADGSIVFIIGGEGALYTAKIVLQPGHEAVGETVAVTPGSTASVIRTSDDGSYVYFISAGVFSGTNAQGQAPQAGVSNLYAYNTLSRETKFIASAEVEKNSGHEYDAQVTPNGRFLAFVTRSQLTPDDTDTAADVYRYDVQTGGLLRVSVGESSADSDGNNSSFDAVIAAPAPMYDSNAFAQWRLGTRAISDDGSTIVFSSSEPLSLHAVNQGRVDVYAWHDGRVGMISTGHSQTSDETPVVSASGRDVFFMTSQNILPQDSDGLLDIYDARIDGGFLDPPVPAGGCSGDSCQGPPSVPELLGAPASATFSGLGNLVPLPSKGSSLKPKVKCKRGYTEDKRSRCVKIKKKVKKRPKSKRQGRRSISHGGRKG